MIHPDTVLKYINDKKGRGVFATASIPKGTLTYVKDELEIEIQPDDPRLEDKQLSSIIETYSYIEPGGTRIISWDHAKYVNHCCDCNTMSTGYGFEIAIRDIREGEEITDEYGLFNFNHDMQLVCEKSDCRGSVSGTDINTFYEEWDEKVKSALTCFRDVEQPLANFLNKSTHRDLMHYLETGKNYRSVIILKHNGLLE